MNGTSVTTARFAQPHRTTVLWVLTAAIVTGFVATTFISGIGLLPIVAEVGFLVVHGTWRYGWRAVAVFLAAGFVISNLLENLSILTGFPFGHYHYTGDGTFFAVPWYITPGYLATGYLSWVVATVLLADVGRHAPWLTTVGTPVVGAFAMTAWDLAMDPSSSTINQWWIWENGGGFFGVPLANFLGWTFTVYLFMQVFALYLRYRGPALSATPGRSSGDLPAVILYAATTLTYFAAYVKRDRVTVTDPSGTTWQTGDIYETSIVLSVYGMLFLALLAALRIAQRRLEDRGRAPVMAAGQGGAEMARGLMRTYA
jgi:putative membrane protein